MSVGNASQAVNFDRSDLTLVLGENLDLGANGSKNGTGKTSLINALSYAFYGEALTKIRVNNLINKTNEKNMLVSVEFDINNDEYRIERGRKPNLLKFYKNNQDLDDAQDDAQGDSRETQKEIEKLLNISHDMFKHTIALNTYTEPFLSMKANDQKNIIEQLLGITVLTEKAELLKDVTKLSKEGIKEEEFRISGLIKANEHIEEQISNLERRQRIWLKQNTSDQADITSAISALTGVDINLEIAAHTANAEAIINADKINTAEKFDIDKCNAEFALQQDQEKAELTKHTLAVNECNKWIDRIERDNKTLARNVTGLQKDIDLIKDHKCHACGQDLHDAKQEENIAFKENELQKIALQLLTNQEQEMEHKQTLADLGEAPLAIPDVNDTRDYAPVLPKVIETFYKTVNEAHEHKSSLATLTAQLATVKAAVDPYSDQITEMAESALQDVDYTEMNRLTELNAHQTFLLKLLTSKDSFIRKKIIEQNLNYLNGRLTHYLSEIGLPHTVKFLSDLSVEITDLGRELDFDNLSRGERTRLILSLSWSFRDVLESMYSHINLMFVDELVDNGLDTTGVEAAIKILKGMARERNKSVWLVSHREELISRVNNTMKVIKSNGFTSYEGLNE